MYNRYKNIKRFTNDEEVPYISNPIYPDIPETEDDTYLISTEGDRYDLLAQSFYGDSTYWWIIASANNSAKDNLTLTPGQQIRVPANKDAIIAQYERLNKNR